MHLSIGHIGLQPADAQRLKVTVGMAAIAGSVSKAWRMSEASDSELVVIAPEDPAAKVALGNRAAYPRTTFAALVGESGVAPPGCLKLAWPIRTDHVIQLLKAIEARQGLASQPPAAIAASPALDLAALLRDLTNERDPDVTWKIRGTPEHSVYVVPAARRFFYRGVLPKLRAMPLDAALTFRRIESREIPHGVNPRPLMSLQWLVGTLTGPLGMFPWIDPGTTLRMRRWPDFPALHHDPQQRRIAAHFSDRVLGTMREFASGCRADTAAIAGFINAASLCGYLVPDGMSSRTSVRRSGDGSRRSLFARLRGALGIAEA